MICLILSGKLYGDELMAHTYEKPIVRNLGETLYNAFGQCEDGSNPGGQDCLNGNDNPTGICTQGNGNTGSGGCGNGNSNDGVGGCNLGGSCTEGGVTPEADGLNSW